MDVKLLVNLSVGSRCHVRTRSESRKLCYRGRNARRATSVRIWAPNLSYDYRKFIVRSTYDSD